MGKKQSAYQQFRFNALKAGVAALATLAGSSAIAAPLSDISVGAGMRTSFTNTDVDGASEKVNDFALDSIRLYTSGSVTETIKFIFNTEYQGDSENDVQVMDAIARFEFSPKFNIWAGRFLPPSDRSNLYGPYYANHWGVYRDGVQDGYPSVAVGRDDGVAYWGDFGRLKVSAGAFDVPSSFGSSDVVAAGRLQVDLWDLEPGYFLNSTYYGEKDLLAFGVAGQTVSGDSAVTLDGLLEKKLPGAGVVTVEAEYANYDGFGGYGVGGASKSDGWYALGAYMFPAQVGIGKFQILGKYGTTTYEAGPDIDQDTTELDLNYLIKTFNARVSLFYIDQSFSGATSDVTQVGVGLQLQM